MYLSKRNIWKKEKVTKIDSKSSSFCDEEERKEELRLFGL